MIDKVLKYMGCAFATLAFISFAFPVFSTRITDGETWNMVIKGYNMVEFSPWGSIVLIAPIILVGLMLSKLKNGVKTIGLLGLLLFDSVALYGALSAAYKWVSDQANSHIEIHMNQLFYALLLFIAMVCFYVMCNFATEEISVEPVTFYKEKFFLCNRPYDFVKYKENGDATLSSCNICFANKEGYFAALNDHDGEEYFNIEAVEDGNAVGFVMGNMPTGVYGMFYEDYDFHTNLGIDISTYGDVNEGKAEVWIPQQKGGFVKDYVYIKPLNVDNIRLRTEADFEKSSILGAAVIQTGQLVAVVTEYDAPNNDYKCISAEMIAVDLCRKIYEHRVFQAIKEVECYLQ